MTGLLDEAEELERAAAEGRVEYLATRFPTLRGTVLDVGCGNGYSVLSWMARGHRAFGVDRSLYRLARWTEESCVQHRLVVADAQALPFRHGTFDLVVSSGMIEHVGVDESSEPYSVFPHPDRDVQREHVIAELARVLSRTATLIVDCPNGAFPVDFWHGDKVGSFRLHGIPDSLLPTHSDLFRWAAAAGLAARVEPLNERLRFRQIRRRWWGRFLSPPASLFLRILDRSLLSRFSGPFVWLCPYLVMSCRRRS